MSAGEVRSAAPVVDAVGRRRPTYAAVSVPLAAVAALVLVLPFYARRPFWFDELVSLEVARLDTRTFAEYVFTVEANMGLYHALLRPLADEGEATVRALSIVFALATLPFLYGLARRLYDERTAVIAVALLAVNVSYVGYARDARSYALTLLLVTASSYLLVRAVDLSERWAWGLYCLTGALAVWAHLFAALVLLAHLAWLVTARRARLRTTLLAAAGLGVLLLPLGLAIALGRQGAQLEWLDPPRLRQLPGLLEWFVESRATVAVYAVGTASALVAASRTRRQVRAPLAPEALLLLWLLVPPATAFVASYASPVYLYRYFLVCLPALVVLVASGFARIRPAWLGLGLAAVALLLSVRTVASCQPDCKIRHDEWGKATAYLEGGARPGDALVVYPAQIRTPLDHHLGAERPRLLYPESLALLADEVEGHDRLADAMRASSRYRRIWLVTWWLPADAARSALSRRATLQRTREFQGNVHVDLYVRP